MSAPIPASSSAVARPMPRPAPVTIATCPESSIAISSIILRDAMACRLERYTAMPSARALCLDRLDHPRRVQRREVVLAESENVGEYAISVLTEQRRRPGHGGVGAVQADRRDRHLRLAAPGVLDLLPDAAGVQVRIGD